MKWITGIILLSVTITPCFADKQAVDKSRYQFSSEQETKSQSINPKEYEVWGLERKDWIAYISLMQGHRGILSPNLDPITALGVEANTEAERRRFAEIHVQFEKQRVEKELAFQRSVDKAWVRLYPSGQLINMDKVTQTQEPVVQPSGRMLFFTTLKPCPDCDSTLSALMEHVKQGRQLDIYVGAAKSDTDIRDWAKSHSIPAEMVRSRIITLNHDKGKLAMISQFTGQVPYLAVKVGSNRYQQINLP
jgi:integrating conjugative element protein (TIGR03759 family)